MNTRVNDWKSKGKIIKYNDYDIFYIKEGKGSDLVIFHGYPYSTYDFKFMWKELTASFTVTAIDMLGMGFSDKPKNYNYTFENHVEIFTEILNRLNVKEFDILAHDLGNSVVQEMIAQDQEGKNPFKIKSIAFLNGGLFIDVYQPRLIQKLLSKSPKPIGKLLSKFLNKKNTSKAVSEVFGKNTKPSQELLDDYWDILTCNEGNLIAYLIGRLVFAKVNYKNRWTKAMQKTSIPMCFINGPADPNSGIHMANRYRKLIPNPNIILLNNEIGHWPQIEDKNAVLKSLFNFYKQ